MDTTTGPGVRFSVAGIPVVIRPTFFLVAFVLGLQSDLVKVLGWVGIALLSVLVNELGHALAMRWFGHATRVEIYGFGGVTHWPEDVVPPASQRLLVWLSGPGAGLFTALICFLLGRIPGEGALSWLLDTAALVNFAWSLINLAPMLPWDGGFALEAAVEAVTLQRRSKLVGLLGVGTGMVMAVLGAILEIPALAAFAVVGVLASTMRLFAPPPPDPRVWWRAVHNGQAARVVGELEAVLELTQEPIDRAALIEVLAWAFLVQGNVAEAQKAVDSMRGFVPSAELAARLATAHGEPEHVVTRLRAEAQRHPLTPTLARLYVAALVETGRGAEVLQLCVRLMLPGTATPQPLRAIVHLAIKRLYDAGDFANAMAISDHAFRQLGVAVHAYNVACCLCRLSRVDEALIWLQKAVEAGFGTAQRLRDDPDLEPLRVLPAFQSLLDRLEKPTTTRALDVGASKEVL